MFALNYILFRLVAIYKVGQKKRHLKNKIKVQNCICHVFRIQIVLLLIKKERKSICFPLSHTPLSIIVYYNKQHISKKTNVFIEKPFYMTSEKFRHTQTCSV